VVDVIFRPDLAEQIVLGSKTATRRIPSDNPRSPWWVKGCRYGFDKDFTVNPGRGKHRVAEAHVTRCALEQLKAMRPKDAEREGLGTIGQFDAYWTQMHGGIAISPHADTVLAGEDRVGRLVVDQRVWVWVVEFKVDRLVPDREGALEAIAALR
jgi:hypothetical protein